MLQPEQTPVPAIEPPVPTTRNGIEAMYYDRYHIPPTPPNETDTPAFTAELRHPILWSDPITGSEYPIYGYNLERFDPNQAVIGLFHPLGSSPATKHGQAIGWEIRQRFPESLIIAIGSEGASDIRLSRNWYESVDSGETLAAIRGACLRYGKQQYGIDENAPTDLIGQSYGGVLAYELARTAPDSCGPEYIQRLALLAAPSQVESPKRFLGQLALQEITGLAYSHDTREMASIARHALEIIPNGLRSNTAIRRLIRIIAETRVEPDNLPADTHVLLCAGSRDTIARPNATPGNNVPNVAYAQITNDAHSSFLIDAPFCAQLIASHWRNDTH